MPSYRSVGLVPPRRHTRSGAFAPDAQPLLPWFEELIGSEGFAGASSLAYHRRSPSALVSIEAMAHDPDGDGPALRANHPLRPVHLQTSALVCGAEPVLGRVCLAGNAHVRLAWWSGGPTTSPLTRDAAGDEVLYVQSGTVRLETTFGALELGGGDVCVVPAATPHRFVATVAASLFIIEAAGGHVEIPDRYLGRNGQMLEGSPYNERAIRVPGAPLLAEDLGIDPDAPVDVVVRTRAGATVHRHASHPFDVIGWDGCLAPWAVSVDDIEPVVGRTHQPPPVHQLLSGPRFVVCAFVPRPLDWGEGAVAVPYHHANVDSDEVLLYSRGHFTSRVGTTIDAGSITVHPAGFTHGPQPGAREASEAASHTQEVAIMVDTFDPLGFTPAALAIDDDDYWRSWNTGAAR